MGRCGVGEKAGRRQSRLGEVTALALQKREKLDMDLVRQWFEPFEDVGAHLDDLLKSDA